MEMTFRGKKFENETNTSKGILDYIHLDVWGLGSVASYGGAIYFLTRVKMLKEKSEVFEI